MMTEPTYSIPFNSKTRMEIEEETPYTDDIEVELQHLHEFDNAKQLDLLKREVGHIMAHNITPSEGWFDERYEYIIMYSNIDWTGLMNRFYNKDHYIHDTSMYILSLINELIDERGAEPNFHLPTYHKLVHNIHNIWKYYKKIYVSEDESDTDMTDLIEGIKFL
jgi:hypothetical protein